jgi:inorganic triphosphatase YgiF
MSRHAAGQRMELEVKFLLPSEADASLEGCPALQSVDVRSAHEVTTYFDTPAGDLARKGLSLRVRRRGLRQVQTLKLRGAHSGAFVRDEWEWPIRTEAPNLDLLTDTPAARLLSKAPAFQAVFVTDVQRTTRTLRHDGATIEAAVDRGRIDAGDATEEIRELELELKDGDPDPMYRLAAMLHADVPMTLGAESKADRGWRLRTGRPREAVKQVGIELPSDANPAEAFRHIVNAVLVHLMANQPAAAAGDAEGVHQMRVAIRRLRAALMLFRPQLESHAEARFTEALRDLGRIFGEARDWDVFCTEMLVSAEEQGVARSWLDLLRGPAEAQRQAAHAHVANEMQRPRLTAVVLGLAEWGTPDGTARDVPLADLAPQLVGRLEHKVLRRGGHIVHSTEEELHALRKALKKLRYSIEFLAPLYRQKQVKRYLHGCKGLLKQLGMLNDAVVTVALAEQLGGERRAELAPAVAALAGWAANRRCKARRHIQKAWHTFRSTSLPTP